MKKFRWVFLIGLAACAFVGARFARADAPSVSISFGTATATSVTLNFSKTGAIPQSYVFSVQYAPSDGSGSYQNSPTNCSYNSTTGTFSETGTTSCSFVISGLTTNENYYYQLTASPTIAGLASAYHGNFMPSADGTDNSYATSAPSQDNVPYNESSSSGSGNVTAGPVNGSLSIAQGNLTPTTATISAAITVAVQTPVSLSYLYGPQGSPLIDGIPVLSVPSPGMSPGQTQNFGVTLTSLKPGTTYQFVLKNLLTNNLSAPLQFTTPTVTSNVNSSLTGAGTQTNAIPQTTTPTVTFQDTTPATGLVPQCGQTPNSNNPNLVTRMCGWPDFLALITNILKYAFVLIAPVASIVALYSGAMIIWLGKVPDMTAEQMAALNRHKTRLIRVVIGILIILLAWIIIATITSELGVNANYTFLDIVGIH